MTARRSRSPSAEDYARAKRLEEFKKRMAAPKEPRETAPFEILARAAEPQSWSYGVRGHVKLSELHARYRRAHILRAWCALRCARLDPQGAERWRARAREALAAARTEARLMRGWRLEGR